MIRRHIRALILLFALSLPAFVFAKPLPLPDNLVAINTSKGEQLFRQSEYQTAFWQLMPYFVTQKNLTYCSVASSAMVLNALQVKAPISPTYQPYDLVTQNNFFTPAVMKYITPTKVNMKGVTLDQLANALSTYDVKVTKEYGNKLSESKFRQIAEKNVSTKQSFILVNFCRKYLGEKGCGHFSPLAAYNKSDDSFLLMDVSRYKYPPTWIKTKDLYKAISTGLDSESNKHRGFIVVSKQA
ncbi:phytochelatin synthase family protein [Vibrio sp. S4M6]|uniref:phytochelatin synthase family protein n=1 Tax=Vibrio sinus TaxID=2946865 RepID=UPI002029C6A3|nr:phytochelatin synthase family protein [Vibrio sinus]MCL9781441.1 phytochelatin synthase family protein [Vibrio sinus]